MLRHVVRCVCSFVAIGSRARAVVGAIAPAVLGAMALVLFIAVGLGLLGGRGLEAAEKEKLYPEVLNTQPPHVSTDKSVRYDFDIVYVKAPRFGDEGRSVWADISHPLIMDPGADLMLLHPDGSEELLVAGGADGAIADPAVSLDGEWVFYSHVRGLKGTSQHGQPPLGGADIFKLHIKSRKTIQLTHGEFTPNTGAANWSSDYRKGENGKTHFNYGPCNMGPFPLPGGRLVFTSNRNGYIPPKHPSPTLQLFVMDDDGKNIEQIGFLNIGMALHPVTLKDGRIMFSSLESQGLRSSIMWGLWSINPDGTNWGPVVSAFLPGEGAPNAFHFQTQLSDGNLVVEEYYNQNNSGFGTYLKMPPRAAEGYAGFGPAYMGSPRNPGLRFGRHDNSRPAIARHPFSPYGIESFTPFARPDDGPAGLSDIKDKNSPKVGKFTHPSAAPDNNLLTVWSPGPANHQYKHLPMPDGGLYLIKEGKTVDDPGQMRLIKNDPKFNEQWPRAVVSYKRIYGVDEPARLPELANDGKLSKHLPAGTPFGLVGTSSFYKRESYPNGEVLPGSVTATFSGSHDRTGGFEELDPFNTSENGASLNWVNQGGDAGRYSNDEIHAVRILAMEPTTHRHHGANSGRRFYSHAMERLRILGEVPLRKFSDANGRQPLDPDGNPDTSFLAKIPADTAFTFQTLNKEGMVLNMAQTWHQLRPGEIRHDCGGCHAHSQQPTPFEKTVAARGDYQVFDLTSHAPLVTAKSADQSGKTWDSANETGLRLAKTPVVNVEYHRDIKPILARSCVGCHSKKSEHPAGNLVLDADDEMEQAGHHGKFPGTYYRLALDGSAKFGHKPVIHNGQWRQTNASRYIRQFQSRRSLLVWKIHGRRTDGWTNDDFPTETVAGDANTLTLAGQPVANTSQNRNRSDLDYTGSQMPPPEAVKAGKVKPLSDEDRRTIVRWIDLGCPIDQDFDATQPEYHGYGWMLDDNRPVLALASPKRGENAAVDKLIVGMYDYGTGLDESSFTVTADFAIGTKSGQAVKPGENLASQFKPAGNGVWQLALDKPLAKLTSGMLTVSIKDKQGNTSRIERTFSVK